MNELSQLEFRAELPSIRTLYEGGDFKLAADRIEKFLRAMLCKIHNDEYGKQTHHQQQQILEQIQETDLPEHVENFDLTQLATLFGITGFLDELDGSSLGQCVINSFPLKGIAQLVEECKENSNRQIDQKLYRIGILQLLNLSITLAYEIGAIELTEEEFIDADREYLRHGISKEFSDLGFQERFFIFNRERGLLLNDADKARNVAFKVETFSNLLAKVYSEICDALSELEGSIASSKIPGIARNIIKNAGEDSGRRFGRSLEQQFQSEGTRLPLEQRIFKWCTFDSDVGFGRFDSAKIEISEKSQLSGAISLTENFLTTTRSHYEDNICSFMKGYIWGVLEELSGLPLRVSHQKKDCAQYVLDSDTCVFNVTVDQEKYRQKKEEFAKTNFEEEL